MRRIICLIIPIFMLGCAASYNRINLNLYNFRKVDESTKFIIEVLDFPLLESDNKRYHEHLILYNYELIGLKIQNTTDSIQMLNLNKLKIISESEEGYYWVSIKNIKEYDLSPPAWPYWFYSPILITSSIPVGLIIAISQFNKAKANNMCYRSELLVLEIQNGRLIKPKEVIKGLLLLKNDSKEWKPYTDKLTITYVE